MQRKARPEPSKLPSEKSPTPHSHIKNELDVIAMCGIKSIYIILTQPDRNLEIAIDGSFQTTRCVPANENGAVESLVPLASCILPQLVCLPANGLRRIAVIRIGATHKCPFPSLVPPWRADVCLRRSVWLISARSGRRRQRDLLLSNALFEPGNFVHIGWMLRNQIRSRAGYENWLVRGWVRYKIHYETFI